MTPLLAPRPDAPARKAPPRRRARWPTKHIGLGLLSAASWSFLAKVNDGDTVGGLLLVAVFAAAAVILGVAEKTLEMLNRK
jgi:hypothetical protein